MISVELNTVFAQAVEYARQKQHEYLTIEHVFRAILLSEEGRVIFEALHVSVNELQELIEAHMDRNVPTIDATTDPIETVTLSRVISDMMHHVHASSQREATVGDMLAALSAQEGSYVVYLLHQAGISRGDILEVIAHPIEESPAADAEEESAHPHLDRFTTELVALAQSGKIDPVIGRTEEIERVMQTLVRRKKNNPLLVGEPGVGKTAIAEGLALNIAQGQAPEVLAQARIFALEMGTLVAGTKFRGDFEKRLKGVIDELKALPDAVIFIDEIHTLVGAGSTGGGSMDASNILKPALARGDIRCIGATTYQEYRNFFDKDKALSRRFARIDVPEPSVEDTFKILKGVQHKYEEHHEIAFSDQALQSAIDLSVKYIHDRFLPDKAMDIIDEVGAHFMLHGRKHMEVTSQEIARGVARMLKLPDSTVDADDTAMLEHLESDLRQRIVGQDGAIQVLVRAIKRAYAGLNRPDTPVGSFLFTGPTGVGKTALATALAETMGVHFERLDMSEYMESHAVSRLIGAPPGYVGFEQGGLLTEMIRKHPHAVVLLDEIEKAHPDIMNILLQVMDGAKLTDNNGTVSDFKNVVLIMTSNLGTKEAGVMGFAKDDTQQTDRAVKAFFSPEFRNRLSAIVPFEPLGMAALERIVKIELGRLNDQLASKQITIKLTKAARAYLARTGYDPQYGARHIARVIDEEVKEPLTDAILFGALRQGGRVKVDATEAGLTFAFPDAQSAPDA